LRGPSSDALDVFKALASRKLSGYRIELYCDGPNALLHSSFRKTMYHLGEGHRRPTCAFCDAQADVFLGGFEDAFTRNAHSQAVCQIHAAEILK
jgi:hypothetical protein